MSTSRLYDSTQAALHERLPLILDSQRTNLALLVTAAAQAQSCHLADLARALPVPTLQASTVQRIRRTLDNDGMTLDTHYRPVVRHAIQGVRGQAIDLILDRVRLKHRQQVVVASLVSAVVRCQLRGRGWSTRFGPVNRISWWDRAEAEPVRAVMTDLPANGFPFQRGRRRIWIETLVRDLRLTGCAFPTLSARASALDCGCRTSSGLCACLRFPLLDVHALHKKPKAE